MQLQDLPEVPGVSYIMPVLNEEQHLEQAVRTVLAQAYEGEQELVLALGPSTDRSNEIADRLASADSRVKLVSNPLRDIPIGLNLAIAQSRFPVIIRVDAHSELVADYTRRGVHVLRTAEAANVGGIMRAGGNTPVQRAIAAAYNSPFGLGGGTYHGDGEAGAAESAYLGIFRREALLGVGGFDEGIRRGEDWELNLRIRQAGGLVWFDPSLQVTYRPRASLHDLARQFFATGAWRAVITRRHPRETPWRFYAPGALVLGLACSFALLLLCCTGVLSGFWWWIAFALPVMYVLAVLFAVTRLRVKGFRMRLYGLCALVTMHLTWGTGFLFGAVGGARRTLDRSRVT